MRPIEHLETRRLLASFTAASVAELVSDINAANAAGGSNTITLTPSTTFKLNAVDNQTDGPTGLPVIAPGDDLTLFANGDTIQRNSATGTPAFRLFAVAAGGSLALNNLTVSGGLSADVAGGGILNQGSLNLDGVTVQNCAAQGRSASGGGIYSVGALTLTNSSIRNNQAIGADGVGVFPTSAAWGWSGGGGGVCVGGGTATVTNTTITSNLAKGGAGANGANVQDGFGSKARYPVRGGQGGNGLGGGLYAASATVTLRATTITGNTASGGAGGTSPKSLPKGADGAGLGGGIYIAPAALVTLDAFTQANTKSNTASTSDNDIFGSFTIL